MALCVCHVAAEFPILANAGIISATLRANADITLVKTSCTTLVAEGATRGDLSITAYAPVNNPHSVLSCPSNAGISYNWDERMECGSGRPIIHTIPKGAARSYIDGAIPTYIISMTQVGGTLVSVSASASSGPHTPYLQAVHRDGYDLSYKLGPISISPADRMGPKNINLFTNNSILPAGTKTYLTNFSWSYTPPSVPTLTYSFLVIYN